MGFNESRRDNLTTQQDSDSNNPDTGAELIPLRLSRAIGFPQTISSLNCQPIPSIIPAK